MPAETQMKALSPFGMLSALPPVSVAVPIVAVLAFTVVVALPPLSSAHENGDHEEDQLLRRSLLDCATVGSAANRLQCFDNLIAAFVSEPGILTPDELVTTACAGDVLCERHGLAYDFLAPTANALEALLSACAKIAGTGRTACYRTGLEAYPSLADADITRGNRTGFDAARLRRIATAGRERCEGKDHSCWYQVLEELTAPGPE